MRNKATLIYPNRLIPFLSFIGIFTFCLPANAQESQPGGGRFSGSLEANANFFMKDAKIGAANTPQYEHQLFGADSWLNLNYSNWGFDFGLRFDLFNNSNLPNPVDSYTDEGIGRWYISKKIEKLDITAGYIYDQIGSGIIYRAYEERPLFIDNALLGVRLGYELTPDWKIKVFTGRQKNRFETYKSTLRGASLEGFVSGGDTSNWSLAPGIGVVSRTQSDEAVGQLLSTVATYTPQDTVSVKYNAYAFTAFNTLTVGNFSWYLEGAYKTPEVFFDPFAEKLNRNGEITLGKFVREPGTVLYSSMSYAAHGLGLVLEGKRTENFTFRADPFVSLNRGMINFLPPMTRQNTYRLTTRYNAATQELGELAVQADIRYAIKRKLSFNVNFSNITTLDDELLYREVYTEVQYKHKNKWQLLGGVQLQRYNQDIYEDKPGVPLVETLTPYFELLYKIDRKKAIRFEGQYMAVGDDPKANYKQDYGDWLFGLAEFTIAPHWTFTASDMFNITPGKNSPVDDSGHKESIHYPRLDIFYTHKSNRFSLSYVKQVEGVVCSGGICRLEPAFSGVKMTVNSSF
ncbi:MAG TPA: DUF6029 family protein [Flavilitoribacter sp.]|nr:DUF6029 family protein [Flavilitoribacter sp.]HMQ87764.1 DUF6029 family protein [Flavilitoribacter sp.]